MISAAEFETGYATRSHVTIEWLRKHRVVLSCDCESDGCVGWQSTSREMAQRLMDVYPDRYKLPEDSQ